YLFCHEDCPYHIPQYFSGQPISLLIYLNALYKIFRMLSIIQLIGGGRSGINQTIVENFEIFKPRVH
ncbi:MAG: hypothetical protein WCF03_10955, partial [Nitrososphaeraceae archaeon]